MFTACALSGPQWPSSTKACLFCYFWTLSRTSKRCQELSHVCAKNQTHIGKALSFKICIKFNYEFKNIGEIYYCINYLLLNPYSVGALQT